MTRIRNEKQLLAALKTYLDEGRNLTEITEFLNLRGVACFACGVELLMAKHNLTFKEVN